MIDRIDLSSTLRQRFLPVLGGDGGGSGGDIVIDSGDGFNDDVVVGGGESAIPEVDVGASQGFSRQPQTCTVRGRQRRHRQAPDFGDRTNVRSSGNVWRLISDQQTPRPPIRSRRTTVETDDSIGLAPDKSAVLKMTISIWTRSPIHQFSPYIIIPIIFSIVIVRMLTNQYSIN
ncbi:MAG: hypothetical protein GY869_08595 [Planctomycetes bacterium]|nr:hypothetical protein [Planctomycetota bacterium]